MSKCPKCGVSATRPPAKDWSGRFGKKFRCGTTQWNDGRLDIAYDCLRNQLAQVTKERDKLREKVEELGEVVKQLEHESDGYFSAAGAAEAKLAMVKREVDRSVEEETMSAAVVRRLDRILTAPDTGEKED